MTLYERLCDCLERQRAWYRQRLDNIEAEKAVEDSDAGELLQRQNKNLRRLDVLQREYAALFREWETSRAMTPSELEDIRSQAREVSALAGELSQELAEAADNAREAAGGVKEQLSALRRGRKDSRRFRPGGSDSRGFEEKA
jgi:septal ring factor EnvC (AmiA/AmiB activator)